MQAMMRSSTSVCVHGYSSKEDDHLSMTAEADADAMREMESLSFVILPGTSYRTRCDRSTRLITHSKPRLETLRQMANRRAATVAAASLQSKIHQFRTFHEDCVHFTKQKIELDAYIMESQLIVLDMMKAMTHDEKISSLFDLFDKDGSGAVDIHELTQGLQKLHKIHALNEMKAMADEVISSFTRRSDDGMLGKHEFAAFLESLSVTMNCNFDDLADLMAMRIAFSETGAALLEEAIGYLVANEK